MRVLIAASEIAPFEKTGGLADIVGTIPKYLRDKGTEPRLIMPLFGTIDKKKHDIKNIALKVKINIGNKIEYGDIYLGYLSSNIPIYFLSNDKYFNREFLYGPPEKEYPDNAERFIFFSKGILETAKAINFQIDIIHLNDWHTSLVSLYMRTLYSKDPFFSKTRTLLTIHNIGYQGIFSPSVMDLTNLRFELYNPDVLEFYGKVNFLKGGIVYSDIITTVSKTYREEILTPEYGNGLEGVLCKKNDDFYGVINGIEYGEWNPETDTHIIDNYSVNNIRGKWSCKKDLLNLFGLTAKREIPVIVMVSRLTPQKGFDLISEAIARILHKNIQLLILGRGSELFEDKFFNLSRQFPEKFGIIIEFDNTLAHKFEAGGDIFLMPSKYEPCGLNQLFSLKYGTVPIVRETGGLNDTVTDVSANEDTGTGFKFKEYSSIAMLSAVESAIKMYNNKKLWRKLIKRCMEENFSIESSAASYIALYKKALNNRT